MGRNINLKMINIQSVPLCSFSDKWLPRQLLRSAHSSLISSIRGSFLTLNWNLSFGSFFLLILRLFPKERKSKSAVTWYLFSCRKLMIMTPLSGRDCYKSPVHDLLGYWEVIYYFRREGNLSIYFIESITTGKHFVHVCFCIDFLKK